jgi:hypothetical protein
MTRTDIINTLIERHGYKTYLEIGAVGENFAGVNAERKTGIDIETEGNESLLSCSSDELFEAAGTGQTFDIVMIDGDSEQEQVEKDLRNSLAHLSPGGAVLLRGTWPKKESDTKQPHVGETFKALNYLYNRPDCLHYTINVDGGITVIHKYDRQMCSTGRETIPVTGRYTSARWAPTLEKGDDYFIERFLFPVSEKQFKAGKKVPNPKWE